jgi:hypothetical protein
VSRFDVNLSLIPTFCFVLFVCFVRIQPFASTFVDEPWWCGDFAVKDAMDELARDSTFSFIVVCGYHGHYKLFAQMLPIVVFAFIRWHTIAGLFIKRLPVQSKSKQVRGVDCCVLSFHHEPSLVFVKNGHYSIDDIRDKSFESMELLIAHLQEVRFCEYVFE